jgi:hypothetical protein
MHMEREGNILSERQQRPGGVTALPHAFTSFRRACGTTVLPRARRVPVACPSRARRVPLAGLLVPDI